MVSIEIIVGLLGGFVLSFTLWWILNHKLVPVVAFSEEISRRPIDYGPREFSHQFALKNIGRRSVINVRLKARLRIIDPRKRGVKISNYFNIALSGNEIFELKPGVMIRFAFNVYDSVSLNTPLLDVKILQKLKEEIITLDGVFAVYPDAECYIQLIGSDIYSNATKVFWSNSYTRKDIRNGIFRGTCLDITPLPISISSTPDSTDA